MYVCMFVHFCVNVRVKGDSPYDPVLNGNSTYVGIITFGNANHSVHEEEEPQNVERGSETNLALSNHNNCFIIHPTYTRAILR